MAEDSQALFLDVIRELQGEGVPTPARLAEVTGLSRKEAKQILADMAEDLAVATEEKAEEMEPETEDAKPRKSKKAKKKETEEVPKKASKKQKTAKSPPPDLADTQLDSQPSAAASAAPSPAATVKGDVGTNQGDVPNEAMDLDTPSSPDLEAVLDKELENTEAADQQFVEHHLGFAVDSVAPVPSREATPKVGSPTCPEGSASAKVRR